MNIFISIKNYEINTSDISKFNKATGKEFLVLRSSGLTASDFHAAS